MSKAKEIGADAGAQRVGAELPDSIALIVDTVDDLKGVGLLVLDVHEVASFTDYLVICSGSSDRHVQALVDGIKGKLRAADITPLHTEGYDQAAWVLIDFVDFLVNVFTPDARDFYQLERVWRDAPVLVGEPSDGEKPAAGAADVAADGADG